MLSRCRSDHPDHGDCCSRGLSLLKSPKMDRSIAKILCLPFFDDAFKAALRDLKIDRVEFWMAMEDESEDTPAQKIANVLPALTSSHEISDKILARSDMINTLAGLVTSSAIRMRDEIAIDLGYGSAETFLPSEKRALSISQPAAQHRLKSEAGLGALGLRRRSHLYRLRRQQRGRSGVRGCNRSLIELGRLQESMTPQDQLGSVTMRWPSSGRWLLRPEVFGRSARTFVTGRGSKSGQ